MSSMVTVVTRPPPRSSSKLGTAAVQRRLAAASVARWDESVSGTCRKGSACYGASNMRRLSLPTTSLTRKEGVEVPTRAKTYHLGLNGCSQSLSWSAVMTESRRPDRHKQCRGRKYLR